LGVKVLSLGYYNKKQTLLKHPKMSSKDTVFYRANKAVLARIIHRIILGWLVTSC